MGIPVVIKQRGGLPIRIAGNGFGTPMMLATSGVGVTMTTMGIPAVIPGLEPFGLGASLLAWWDASTGVTVTGAGVSSWVDRVGGYDLVQATDAARPTYSATGFNGDPALDFNGTSHFMNLEGVPGSFPTGAAPSEIWFVGQQDALAAETGVTRPMFAYGSAGAGQRSLFRLVTGDTNRAHLNMGATVSDTVVDFSSRHVVRAQFGATSSISVDGQAETSALSTLASGTTRVRLGCNLPDTPTVFWNGKVRDLIITTALSAAQATALQTFLLARRML